MTFETAIQPEDIRLKRAQNPKMRERDLSQILGISEAELVAAHCGYGVQRIEPRLPELLAGIEAVGTVMALTRNESAVHEKIGVYENSSVSEKTAIVLGEQIDLRIFPTHWVHAFAVEKHDETGIRHSLQFFDQAGDAVHKIHLRAESDLATYKALVEKLVSENQNPRIEVTPIEPGEPSSGTDPEVGQELVERWSAMKDVHQLPSILRALKLSRYEAVKLIGPEFAWQLDHSATSLMMERAVAREIPIMCFVGSRGCIQIHSGPVKNIAHMGPWFNVMDPTFHLHLRLDHLAELWAVRKPTRDGHVTSFEGFDTAGKLIIQFFGKRHEGEDERGDWRALMEELPRLAQASAA